MHGVWGLALDILELARSWVTGLILCIYYQLAPIELAARYTKIEYTFGFFKKGLD